MAPRTNKRNKSRRGRKATRNNNMKTTTRTRDRMSPRDNNNLSNTGSIVRPLREKPMRLQGSDFVGSVQVGDPVTVNDRVIFTLPLSPNALQGTRLEQLANLWERYRFHSAVLRWVPAVPNTLACQFVVYIDTDPQDDPTTVPDSDALIRQAMAQAGAQQFNFIHPRAIQMARRSDDQMYYTGPVRNDSPRFSQQGVIYCIQVTDTIAFDGSQIKTPLSAGTFYLDWDVEFQIAQINPAALQSDSFNTANVNFGEGIKVQTDESVATTLGSLIVGGPVGKALARVAINSVNRYIDTNVQSGTLGNTGVNSYFQIAGQSTLATLDSVNNDGSGMEATPTNSQVVDLKPGAYSVAVLAKDLAVKSQAVVLIKSLFYRFLRYYGATVKYADPTETAELMLTNPSLFLDAPPPICRPYSPKDDDFLLGKQE